VELAHHNVFFGADPKVEFDDLARGRMPQDPRFMSAPQDRGGPAPGGAERFEIIMNGPPGTSRHRRGRENMPDTHLRDLARMGLSFSPAPGIDALTTPRGFQRGLSRVGRFPLRAEPAWNDGDVPAPDGAHARSRASTLRGRGASGGGDPDGLPLRQARGRGDLERPCFDIDVPPDGYAWWYVDGISDDGARAISIIGFIGSVFSPWYRWSGAATPPIIAA
jgi:hypothetical protein